MRVFFSKKCDIGIKAVLFLSIQEKNQKISADTISNELNEPREFISKTLQELTKSKIVASRKGKDGGFYLNKEASEIRLIDIIAAIDGLDVFKECVLGFSGCNIETPCPVHDTWGPIRERAYKLFSTQTLEDLKEKTEVKIYSIKNNLRNKK
ncbi:MAG TPA: Rrf2 family transcriptional regulator [Candidatus Kapabacteria bacterium]|nr:Rrf2 family transcriptional regulator [Candidatus Kapabacteria bacterium]